MCELAANNGGKCTIIIDVFGKMCYALIIPPERMVTVMKRNAIRDLTSWKNNDERKPLALKGACYVGKTWLMKEFGKNYYKIIRASFI